MLSVHSDAVSDLRALAVRGGVREDEAIALLRQFYATENQSAPMPQKRTRKQLELAGELLRSHESGDVVAKSSVHDAQPESHSDSMTAGST